MSKLVEKSGNSEEKILWNVLVCKVKRVITSASLNTGPRASDNSLKLIS